MADIQLIDPQGKVVSGPSDPASVQAALAQGYKEATPENLEEVRKQQTYGEGTANELKTFAQGVGEGVTFGASTPLAVKTGILSEEAAKERPERNPLSHMAGVGTGVLGSSLALPGGGAVGAVRAGSEAAAEGLIGAIPATGSRVLNYARGIGQEALGSGIEGAAYGLGNSVAEGDLGDPKLNAEKIMANVGSGALLGGIIGGGTGAIKGLMGPAEEGVESLLGKSKSTPEMLAQKGEVDATLSHAMEQPGLPPEWRDTLADAQKALQKDEHFAVNAHDALTDVQEKLQALDVTGNPEMQAAKDHLVDHVTERLGNADVWGDKVAAQQVPTGNAGRDLLVKTASSYFGVPKDAIEIRLASPQAFEAAPTPFEFAQKVKEAVGEFKQGLSDDSTASRNMVASTGKSIPVEAGIKPLEDAAASLRGGKGIAVSPSAEQAAKLLEGMAEKLRLRSNGADMPLTELWDTKKAMQGDIDKLINSGERHAAGEVGAARTSINDVLKREVPGYTEHMAELAKDAKTFDKLGKGLQSDNGILNFVKRVGRGQSEDTFEKQALRLFDERNQSNLMDEARQVWAKDAFTKASTNGSRKTLLGGSVGAAVGHLVGMGPVGGMVGAGVGAFLDTNGGEMLSKLMNNAERLGALEKNINKATNTLNKAAKAVFDEGKSVALATGTDHENHERHQLTADKLRQLASNLDAMSDHVGSFVAPVYDAAPQHASAMAGMSTAAISFLASKLPANRQSSLFSKAPGYAPGELLKFQRYLDVLKDPVSVLGTLKTGSVPPEGLETLKTVYPTLYGAMQSRLLHEATNLKDPSTLPYKTRLGVSQFLGMPLDASLNPVSIQANQASRAMDAQMGQQKQHQAASQAAGKNTLGSRYSTTFDSTSKGKK